MQTDFERELGRLQARVDGMESWANSLDDKLSEIATTMKAIEIELASAKGGARLLLGVVAAMGSVAGYVLAHATELKKLL